MNAQCPTRITLVLLALMGTALTGCGSDNDDALTVVPPLVVRSIFPESGVMDFTGEIALSVTFDRPAPVGEVIMELHPRPAQAGSYGPTGSGRNWAWEGAFFAPEDGAYAWVIDGLAMRQPLVVNFASGDRIDWVGFTGRVLSQNASVVTPDGALVFALPDDAGFNPLDPVTFLEAKPKALSAVVSVDLDPVLDGPAWHRFRFMQFSRGYVVVAVKDTNNDLIYDPTSDWWGYHQSSTSLAAEIVFAEAFADTSFNGRVDITLRPPSAR